MTSKRKFKVLISASRNPDLEGGYWPGAKAVKPYWAEVESLEDASRAVQAAVRDHGWGGGNWTGGEVRDAKGKAVAYVSYNGRVWPMGEWEPGQKPLLEAARLAPTERSKTPQPNPTPKHGLYSTEGKPGWGQGEDREVPIVSDHGAVLVLLDTTYPAGPYVVTDAVAGYCIRRYTDRRTATRVARALASPRLRLLLAIAVERRIKRQPLGDERVLLEAIRKAEASSR